MIRWPKLEPMTRRMICESFWNQRHDHCAMKLDNPGTCFCACLDRVVRHRTPKPDEGPSIAKVYGTIEIK